MKFCPTPKDIGRFKLAQDLTDFARTMKFKVYFIMKKEGQFYKDSRDGFDKFKEKSNWIPTKVDPALELFPRNLEDDILSISGDAKSYRNLTREEQLALRELIKI